MQSWLAHKFSLSWEWVYTNHVPPYSSRQTRTAVIQRHVEKATTATAERACLVFALLQIAASRSCGVPQIYPSLVQCVAEGPFESLRCLYQEMSERAPDCPRTINPALLTRVPPHLGVSGSKASTSTDETNPVGTTKPRTRRPPRLPRISSDCDPQDELQAFLLMSSVNFQRTRREFDGLPGAHSSRIDRRISAHRRYFKIQTEEGGELHIPPDPEADEDAEIVVDTTSSTIYDAYLLSADVAKNRNSFQRLRVGALHPDRGCESGLTA